MNVYEIINILSADETDNKLVDFAIQLIATLLAFAGAWLLFWMGNRYNKNKSDAERATFEQDKLRYCHSLISASETFADKLTQYLDEFTASIKDDPTMIPRLTIPVHNKLERFVHEINQEDHFHAYLNQLHDDSNIINIFDQLDFIENLRVNVYQQFKEAAEINARDRKEFTSKLNAGFQLFLALFPLSLPKDQNEFELFEVFHAGLGTYKEIYQSGNLSAILEEFLDPVTKAIIAYHLAVHKQPYDAMLTLFASASSTLNHSKRNNLNICDGIVNDRNNLKIAHTRIMSLSKPLNKFIEDIDKKKNSTTVKAMVL